MSEPVSSAVPNLIDILSDESFYRNTVSQNVLDKIYIVFFVRCSHKDFF